MVESTSEAISRRDRTASAARSFVLSGNRTGLLLLHGFAGSIADLRQLGQALHQRGYSIFGARLAGHGTSIDDLHQTVVEDWLAAARTALRALAERVEQLVIIGESMGALLALRLAREDQRVASVVLLAPALALKHERLRDVVTRVLPPNVQWRKPWSTPERVARGSPPAVTTAAYRQLMRLVRAERGHLPEFRLPVLALFAAGDFATDQRGRKILEQGLPPRLLTVETLDAAAHHLGAAETLPHVVEAIDRFVRSRR